MADLTITPANVIAQAGANASEGTAGVAITAGQMLYKNASDGKMYLADANLSLAAATALGVALHAAAVGQPIRYAISGDVAFGAILTVGAIYVLSATDSSGAIAPVADLASGWFPMVVGIAWSTSVMTLLMGTQSTPTAHS